jgi:phosphonate transport system permease protein
MKDTQIHATVSNAQRVRIKNKKISIGHKKTIQQQRIFFLTVFVLFAVSLYFLEISYTQFAEGLHRIPNVLSQMMTISFGSFAPLLKELVISVIVAFLSVVFSVIVSIFLSFLVAANITPNKYLCIVLRWIFLIIRTIPTTIWVLLAVASVGFGSMAGVLGLILPTSAYLIKMFSAQIEEAGNETIEALKSVGGTWWHIIFKGLLPTLLTSFLATIAFRFELNVAESVILGMVGAGGIGYLLQGYISYYQFSDLSLGIIMVFTTMFLLEMLTNQIRIRLKKQ